MPRLTDAMKEGVIVRWLKADGDSISAGQDLVEIETDKATAAHEAETDGIVRHMAREGDAVAVGETIAWILAPGETAPASGPAQLTARDRVKVSPIARRLARELQLDLAEITGSGPGGRIVKSDIEAARSRGPGGSPAAPTPVAPAQVAASPGATEKLKGEVRVHELSSAQRTISRRMSEAKANAPEFELTVEIDMSECIELRSRLKSLLDPAPSLNDMVIKAAADALRAVDGVNGAYGAGRWEFYSRVNVGVVVATRSALVVPTVFDADQKPLASIARLTRQLIARAHEGTISPSELAGGTFTVSNLGMHGIDTFSAVINPPQAAILAVGTVKKRPVVDESGQFVARDMMAATLTCDHRIIYGTDAADFLGHVRRSLERPLSLFLAAS